MQIFAIFFSILCAGFSLNVTAEYQPVYQEGIRVYANLLAETVTDGKVDYEKLKSLQPRLNRYLQAIASQPLDNLTISERKALLINAYNAFTLQLILDYWPNIQSIKDIPDNFFSGYKRWEDERWRLAGDTISLDFLEHKMLRPMGDARIHFAIVCASISCPDLAGFVYDDKILDQQLGNIGKNFLADSSKGLSYTEGDPEIHISKIFSWFRQDFERDEGTVVQYLIQHADKKTADFLTLHQTTLEIEYLDYDWNLNKRSE